MCDLWESRWEVGDKDDAERRIWNVTYARTDGRNVEFVEIYAIFANVPVFGGLDLSQSALVFALANMPMLLRHGLNVDLGFSARQGIVGVVDALREMSDEFLLGWSVFDEPAIRFSGEAELDWVAQDDFARLEAPSGTCAKWPTSPTTRC